VPIPSIAADSLSSLPHRRAGDQQIVVAGIALFIFFVSLWQNLGAVPESQFHPDESRWLNRSHYLRDLFHPTSKVWEDRYLTRGQPPMGSYVTAVGLLFQGRSLDQHGPWDFHFGNETSIVWNAVKGNMPAPGDLVAARRTSAAVGALTCVVLFLTVARLTNVVGGAIAALFLAFHPLQIYLASLAVSDAVFTLFVALATYTIVALAAKPSWLRAITLGVVLGLGASTKLSPLFVAATLAALGPVILADGLIRRVPLAGSLWSRWSRVDHVPNRRLGWMLVSLPAVTFGTFVATYPYLWPDPIGRTQLLLNFRQNEMDNQARIWTTSAIDSRLEALQRTWQNLEHTYSTTGRVFAAVGRIFDRDWSGFGIDLPLAIVGFVLLARLALTRGLPSKHSFALAVLGLQSAVILLKLRIDFNRYYVPLIFICALGIGILVGQAWDVLLRAVIRRSSSVSPRLRQTLGTRPLRSPGTAHRQSTAADR
jgi:hypothetical protein